MPETPEAIRGLADTMITRFTPPTFVPGCEVKSIADISEYAADNGWLEAIVGGDNQQRVRYYGTPQGVAVNDFVDVEYFPAYKLYRVFGATLGGTATVGGLRVDKIWESDFGAVALEADANGNIGIGIASPDTPLHVFETVAASAGIVPSITMQTSRYGSEIGGGISLDFQSASDTIVSKISSDVIAGSDFAFGIWSWDGSALQRRITIRQSGNVGIGAIAPSKLLTLRGQGNTEWLTAFRAGSDIEQFGMVTAEGTGYTTDRGTASGTWTNIIESHNSDLMLSTNVAGGTGGDILLDADAVGIGTVSPTAELHIEGVGVQTIRIKNVTHGAGDHGYIHFIGEDGSGNIYNSSRIIDLGPGTARIGQLQFQTGFGNVLNTIMTLTAISGGGNVGIGTASPSTRLDIDAGAMEFAEMTAPGAGAPNTGRVYFEDNGAGKTRMMVIFNTGAAQQIAIQP